MTTWFTSDHHFGHSNIIKYCNRPFKNADQMDREMIDRWNEVVKWDDDVWYLGDFTLGSYDKFLTYTNRLNGRINIVPGGHDERWLGKWATVLDVNGVRFPGATKVYIYPPLHNLTIERKKAKSLPIVMCHYPMMSWDRSHYGSLHLYGHVHNSWGRGPIAMQSSDLQIPPGETKGKRINVGVDVWDFYPAKLEKLLDMAGISGTLRT